MSVLASDNFTRADASDLGSSWDENTGESSSGGFDISSNTAIPSNTSLDSSETNNAATWPNDQYSQVTHGATTSDGAGAGSGPTCRAATGSTLTYYRLVGNGSGYELGKKVTGAFTSLSSGTGTTFASTNTNRLTLNGTGWSLSKNGGAAYATGTDASIASGRAGIGFSSSSTSAALTAWEGGDLTGGGGGYNAVPLLEYYQSLKRGGVFH